MLIVYQYIHCRDSSRVPVAASRFCRRKPRYSQPWVRYKQSHESHARQFVLQLKGQYQYCYPQFVAQRFMCFMSHVILARCNTSPCGTSGMSWQTRLGHEPKRQNGTTDRVPRVAPWWSLGADLLRAIFSGFLSKLRIGSLGSNNAQ